MTDKQEQGEPVACDNCKKLEDELEPLRIKSELWKRDAIVWKSAYDVEVGYREQEQGEPVAQSLKDAVFTVLEGFTLDSNVRKILESAYYTTPQPAQKPWVGLTMNEMDTLMEVYDVSTYDYIKAIEAKLKEKNT